MSESTTAAARELGADLKRLRTAADHTLRSLADVVGFSDTKLSFWEQGSRLPAVDDLTMVLTVLGVEADERDRLLGLRQQAASPGELVAGSPTIGPQLAKFVNIEQTARRITEVSLAVLPGLLQTEAYARVVLGAESESETKVRLRMDRQRILTRDDPSEFRALIDDTALVRPIGSRAVMVEQWQHLMAMAERPNITVQVIPSTVPGYSPHLLGSFILLEFATASPIVHLEHFAASSSLWRTPDVSAYQAAAEEVDRRALTPADSAEHIAKLIDGTAPNGDR
ncbi:helix-turn-helix domain-containing protein [Actinokineospora spheciospongiae]|uniref:helix-turn-helix domain-containing protein n=1 Tax=Actinokineospora spheciospongiae TaxID=909613 RepID=UPI000D718101|nr:helix-turn-helix transcriptional regulator [Actinokineospora spheciospongiae]PWW66486.1 helix-turn-helix protein [Actinokineospora spheciospongiae]